MGLLERLHQETDEEIVKNGGQGAQKDEANDPYREVKKAIYDRVIQEVRNNNGNDHGENTAKIEEEIKSISQEVMNQTASYLTRNERNQIVQEIVHETIGFGPITPLLHNPDITEIMVNGYNSIYIEKEGKLVLSDIKFKDNDHVMHIIERIVSPLGRRIDESSPMVDARFPNGSRVNIIIPPLALNGPVITIRKFSEKPFTVNDLIRFGTMTPEMSQFLKACVAAKLNIVVSGGTGSGKTTTLNVISSFIPSDERIITIEDAAELQLHQEHIVRLETRPPNVEGKGAVTIRELVKNSLRMRPDRIIVGEVRGGEALDMLQAMNTGHDGSLTTGHANSPRDMLSRLETMVLMAGMELPIRAIREQISSAVNLIVQQARLRDGTRRITHITEITGMEGDIITLQDIFVFKREGKDSSGRIVGSLTPTGIKPKSMDKILQTGILLPANMFGY